jgi:hypothetical protein
MSQQRGEIARDGGRNYQMLAPHRFTDANKDEIVI